jgi:hypothetical protein
MQYHPIGQYSKRFRSLLNPQTWREPKTLQTFIVFIAGTLIGCIATKWVELKVEEQFKSAGISVEYGKIESLASSDLDGYAERVGCGRFGRNLDDDVLTNYFVIPLNFRNFTRNPVGAVRFVLQAGCPDAKIIDVQYSVRTPKGKMIAVRNDLPTLKWSLPTNSVNCTVQWNSQPYASANVFCSVAKDISQSKRGFVHYIDTPPERDVVFTYTFYASDNSGNQSYPIVVNASLDSSASNCTFRAVWNDLWVIWG